jgi:hypothetical protein
VPLALGLAVMAACPAAYAQVNARPISPAPPASSRPAKGSKARTVIAWLRGAVRSAAAESITVSGTLLTAGEKSDPVGATRDWQITLTPRGSALRLGKAVQPAAFQAGDHIVARGHESGAGQFSASAIMDSASEDLASLSRQPPLLAVTSIDSKTGEISLENPGGDLHLRVRSASIRLGRRAPGAVSGLIIGQSYGVRLSRGMDGRPVVSLTPPRTAAAPPVRSRKSVAATAAVSAAPGGPGTSGPTSRH